MLWEIPRSVLDGESYPGSWAALPSALLSSSVLLTVVPQLPSSPHEGQLMQTKPTPQTPAHFQSEKLPDPASSQNSIICIFMPIPGFYYPEYYLSFCRTYWEILDALDPGSTVKNVFVEAVILLLWNNKWLNNFQFLLRVWWGFLCACIQLLARTTFWFKSSLGHGN